MTDETKPKKLPPNAGKGRVKGVPNKATADARATFSNLLNWAAPQMQDWVERVARKNPDRALTIITQLADFCIPRLGRIEHTGEVRTRDVSDEPLTAADWESQYGNSVEAAGGPPKGSH